MEEKPQRGGGGLGRSSGFKVGNHEVKDGKMGIGKRKERRNVEAGFNEVTDRRALGSDSVGWSVVKEMGLNTERQEEINRGFWPTVAP